MKKKLIFNPITGKFEYITRQLNASEVVNVPSGTISSTNVQAAINELATEKVPTTRSINAGTGLSGGGTLTIDRTLNIANTTVVAGNYGTASQVPSITVNAQGQLTSASNTAIQITQSQVTNLVTNLANKQPLDSTLTALAAYNTNGILTQTATDTFVGRTITATTPITITNGNGVSGDPAITHANSGVTAGSYGSATQTPQVTVNATGHVTGVSLIDISPNILKYYSHILTNTITTTSTTFSSTQLTIATPVAGTYLVLVSANVTSNVSGSNNNSQMAVYLDTTIVSNSTRDNGITMSGTVIGVSAAANNGGYTSTIVTVNGSQNVNVYWRRSSGSTTHTLTNRHLVLLRLT